MQEEFFACSPQRGTLQVVGKGSRFQTSRRSGVEGRQVAHEVGVGREEALGRGVGQRLQPLQRGLKRAVRTAGVARDVEGAEGVDELPAESRSGQHAGSALSRHPRLVRSNVPARGSTWDECE